MSLTPAIPSSNPTGPEIVLADWARTLERSLLRQLVALVSRPGILSFAGGLPAPELFPQQAYADALVQVLRHDRRALQYGPPYPPLQEHIVALMAQRGVTCRPEQVFITTGAQQALNVLTRLLLNPGGPVILEKIVYTGMQQALAPLQPEILSVATDLVTGIDLEGVAALLAHGRHPAFIYAIPEAHNPLGVSIDAAAREKLVALARRHGVPIVEDDPYGFLVYEDELLPPLKALDEAWVFYVGSFSKIIAPALRLGWIVAPQALLPRLTVVKEADDLETSALTQRAVATFLEAGHLPAHLQRLRSAYRARRDAMLQALAKHFPTEAHWTRPRAGMFIWVTLPPHVDTQALLEVAVREEQVAFVPGAAFARPASVAGHCLRLNFSNASVEEIADGIMRLGHLVKREL